MPAARKAKTPPPAVDPVEALEDRLLDRAVELAPHLGWTSALVRQAATAEGLSQGERELVLPHGARDLAALLARRHDRDALAALAGTDPNALKIRERIRRGALAHLAAGKAHEAATRRWLGFLSLPMNLPLALRLLWDAADTLWRWAGDTATDENHYSKRAILSGILAGMLAVRLSEGQEAAEAFLDRRIDNVMAFEKWKATTSIKPADLAMEVAGMLGRLRYL